MIDLAQIRNFAIVAHIDHGKSTLADRLLECTGTLDRRERAEQFLDKMELEKERGITIHSKETAIEFEGVRIHLVDTPGHSDFGGEVERVLGMVDAVLLLVDAVEGVMPQTRFVVGKALARGLCPLVVVNKVDRAEQRADAVVDEVFDLLVALGASDEQLDFPVVYASAKEGTAVADPTAPRKDLRPLLEAILEHIPVPEDSPEGSLQLQISSLDYSDFVGRIGIGRVYEAATEWHQRRPDLSPLLS